ncbi:MAG: hypothetical protein HY511_01160 [Actinobacteria bacterium]|nr:hypothetical protein [Actinomycetota bacterium]
MSPVAAIAGAGACALLGGVLVALRPRLLGAALALQIAGVSLLGGVGAAVLLGADPIGSGFSGAVDPAVGIDGLTGFFLASLALVAVPALVFAHGYLPGSAGAPVVVALTGAFVASLAGVLTARDITSFLGFWELMTLVPAAAILVSRREDRARRTVFVYLAVTHLGGAGVWVALLTLARHGAFADPSALGAKTQLLVGIAALVGFGTKAGLMPFHSWLPRAHPVAPSHVSALMSGMMIKVALYGLVRVCFEWLPEPLLWLGLVLLGLGLLSSLGGVLYALVQHDLKRLLAFHSIENVGIIAHGLGASLVFAHEGEPLWASVAFAAALLHTLNHAVFKALLFLGAGAFDRAVHGLELDRLGGLLRRMPWTGAAFAVGAAAIAGLPPLNGFASEWLTLQALLHLTGLGSLGIGLAGGVATAGLAATAALAVYCFVKVIGLVLLGPPRRRAVAEAVEAPLSMRAAVVFLAGLCVVLGVLPGLLLPKLAALAPGGAALPTHPGFELPGTGSLPAPALAIALVLGTGALLGARGRGAAAPAPAWACGQPLVPALGWTSAGFTKPLRLMLETVLRPERSVTVRTQGGVVQEISYEGRVPHLFDTKLYRPVVGLSVAAAAHARRLQSGSLRAYVLYLLALVVFLLALVRTGALG